MTQATTRIDVFRDVDASTTPDTGDTDFDEWGNEIETPRPDTDDDEDTDPDPYLRDLPASIIERTMRSPDPSTGDLRTIRYLVGRVTNGTDVQSGDIISDRRTGERYRVAGWSEPRNPMVRVDRRLELERTS
jgi:hypothetical protein